MKRALGLILALACLPALLARADVRLPAILGSNMVLQQDKPLPVWGWADPGETVTVTLLNQKKTATPGPDGKWIVKLDPIPASADAVEMTVAGKNTLTLKNLLVGEVWVCSGQSNMGFTLNRSHNAEVEIPKAKYPKIRLFTVARNPAFEPQADCKGEWVECTPETAPSFTAVGYFFGRDIHQALNQPVGLINTSWGGTPAQAWTAIEGLKSDPALEGYVKSYTDTVKNLEASKARYTTETLPRWETSLKKWQEEVGKPYQQARQKWAREAAAAKAAGKPAPPEPEQPKTRAPRKPDEPGKSPNVPTVLNNGMIAPIVPLAVRGAIWYQGESNSGMPVLYRALFPAMIKDWRRQWAAGDQGDFPFLWVQLANYMKRDADPTQSDGGWPGLREAQSMTLKLHNTGQAVIIDIGEGNDIHPTNKADVGKRLALAGLKVAYGKDLVYSGPTYDAMKVDGDKIRISFKNTGTGLAILAAPPIRLNQPPSQPLDKLVGFSIAGADKKFVWANARIEGNEVVVWSDQVKQPVAVRYAWANNPECNLYNKEGLPASPFRTDDWTAPAPQGKR